MDSAEPGVEEAVALEAEDLAGSGAAEAAPEEEAQVAAGKTTHSGNSPIIDAIALAEEGTTGEVRVHLSRKFFERDPYARAAKLFARFGMWRTANKNAVLLYVNLRRHKFAVYADEGIYKVLGQEYWNSLSEALSDDLRKMPAEKAIAIAVVTIGETLKKYFPAETGAVNENELKDEVSHD
ncbi:MAG TPA: hypothetical protein DCS07_13445 [Bdellovibrionales bacterium]|nr:hypothetical protein [Bdellovibrionales bacterium]HCM40953.1 hypothetical protein [Bdellovibrionales bacterium]